MMKRSKKISKEKAPIRKKSRPPATKPRQTEKASSTEDPCNVKTTKVKKPLQLTDVVLRDAHQSLLATRMRTEDMLPIAERLDAVGYWSLEVWGGATYDTCLRYLKEDPWERLRALRAAMPKTKLQMLLRGQNLVGYRHYADDVLEAFIERSAFNGIDVFRIFDALNDVRNMKRAMWEVKSCGKHVEAAISYTVSPVHSLENFLELAKKLEDLGTDTLCIKDMAGLLAPMEAYNLVKRLKETVQVPIHLHTHYTSGMASMSAIMAVLAGLDMLDTAMGPLAGGTSHPTTETTVATFKNTPFDTGLDLAGFEPIAEHFKKVRKKYHQFESDVTGVDLDILASQIPGGMLSNLVAQLAQQDSLDRLKEVLAEVPLVRKDMGYPPLVTPSSQIVGTQATLNVVTGERYKVITSETKNYFLGLYGSPPGKVNREVKTRAIGDEKPITGRPADHLEPELEAARNELGSIAASVEDTLSFAMFPTVARDFFEERAVGEFKPEKLEPPPDKSPAPPQELHLAPVDFNLSLHGETFHVQVSGSGRKKDGRTPYYIRVNEKLEEVYLETLHEVLAGVPEPPDSPDDIAGKRPKPTKPGDVVSPMPGKIIKVLVAVGDAVATGDPLIIVEAMKMENRVPAPIDGSVTAIYIQEGDDVKTDETLVQLE